MNKLNISNENQLFNNNNEKVADRNTDNHDRVALYEIQVNINKSSKPMTSPKQFQLHSDNYTHYEDCTDNETNIDSDDLIDKIQLQPNVVAADHDDVQSNIEVYDTDTESNEIHSSELDEVNQGNDEDEIDYEEIPEPFELKTSPEIDQELQDVYLKFHRDILDPMDDDIYEINMVSEYSPEIFNYLHELELKLRPDPYYMELQHEIRWYMRSTLIDWLVQIHSRFKLLPETLFLTINYIDRFLSKRKVSLSRFQLVGSVALYIAAKYEEINCPSLKEIVHISEYVYSEEEIIKAEKFMIDVLDFDMGWPGPMGFLRRTSKADEYDIHTRTLAKYLLESTIMDYKFVNALPSWLAAGSHFLARLLLNRGEWTAAHIYYSGYTSDQLLPLAKYILGTCRHATTHHNAIFEKYQQACFRKASIFVQDWLKVAYEE